MDDFCLHVATYSIFTYYSSYGVDCKLALRKKIKIKNYQSGNARHVMRTRVLRRLIVRYNILILLIKSVRCSTPHCIYNIM